jgi:hypothetical protein
VRARSTLLACAVLPLLTSSCGNTEDAGSYVFPTAIIGIRTSVPAEARRLERQVTSFAVANHLDVYYRTGQEPIRDPLRSPLSGDAFEYAPSPPDLTHGFSLALEKLADGCFIVQFSERSPSWTPQSLARLAELERQLTRSLPGRVHLLVHAKPEQNWPTRQRLRYLDPEWPERFELLCERMKGADEANASSSAVSDAQ